jgi:hypothetical protein
MSVDDLLFMIIIVGMVLSIAYLRAQYLMRRSYRIAERGAELRLRELYGTQPIAQCAHEDLQKPASRAVIPRASPDAVPHRSSLPVHVRFVYRAPGALDGRQMSR